MSRRQDTHRPSAIIPDEYEYVAQEVMRLDSPGDCWILLEERKRIEAHIRRTGGSYSGHAHGGNCMVCGNATAIYTVLFYHAKTNTYVRTGQDCAIKMGMGGSEADFSAFRAGIKDHLAAVAGKKKAAALLAQWGIFEAVQAALAGDQNLFEERTITDLHSKLVTYGYLTEKQQAFLLKLLEQIPTRAVRQQERDAERAAAEPAPTGRAVITGVVLKTKAYENVQAPWLTGPLKMTVKDDRGFIVWGTVPLNIEDYDNQSIKGRRISFRATIVPSKDDPKFAFFKRPANCKLLPESGAAQ